MSKLLRVSLKSTLDDSNHLNNSQKDYWFLFFCVLYLGGGTAFTNGSLESFAIFGDHKDIYLFLGKIFMILFAFSVAKSHKLVISKAFFNIIGLFIIVWSVLQYIKYETIAAFPVMRFMNLYFAYIICKVYSFRLVYYFEDACYKLAYIGLILWGLLVIFPSFIITLGKLSPIEPIVMQDGSFGVWVYGMVDRFLIPHNFGFGWEPGRTGCIISLAIFFNLIINNFTIRNNKRFKILALYLFSTLSTTAFLCFLFICIFYLYNINKKYFVFGTSVFFVFAVYIMSLDFMWEKISTLWISKEHIEMFLESQINYYASINSIFVPQRFDGLYLEFKNILHDPIIGNGFAQLKYLETVYGAQMSLSNGTLKIFANLGVIAGVVYYYYLIKASRRMAKTLDYKGDYFFLFIFVMINISYSFIYEPLFLSLILRPIFDVKREIKKSASNLVYV